jgi:hypothetical protein
LILANDRLLKEIQPELKAAEEESARIGEMGKRPVTTVYLR